MRYSPRTLCVPRERCPGLLEQMFLERTSEAIQHSATRYSFLRCWCELASAHSHQHPNPLFFSTRYLCTYPVKRPSFYKRAFSVHVLWFLRLHERTAPLLNKEYLNDADCLCSCHVVSIIQRTKNLSRGLWISFSRFRLEMYCRINQSEDRLFLQNHFAA